MARQCAQSGRVKRWFDVVVVVGLIGVAREFVVGDCRVGRGGWRTGEDVSSFAIRTNSGCTLVARANGKEDCRCSLQPTHSLPRYAVSKAGQQTRNKVAWQDSPTVCSDEAPRPTSSHGQVYSAKKGPPLHLRLYRNQMATLPQRLQYAGDMTGRIR